MDRRVVYVGELPRSADFLGFQKDALYALGYMIEALLGSPTCVQGLDLEPTAPASLNLTISPGAIYAQETVDANAFGGLGQDANTVLKQGLLLSPAALSFAPPPTTGYAQVYLVQAGYSDVDSNPIVLPYYNSANPLQPLNGPNGSGQSQYTVRAGVCEISVKAGAAAPAGTQTAPSVDPGNVGLYLVTVANGQTSITSGNIAVFPGAPFIPLTLPEVPPAIQAQADNFAVATGTANALAITLPARTPDPLPIGMPLRIKKNALANTAAVTLAVNGHAPFAVVWEDGTAMAPNDWPASAFADGVFDGTALRVHGPVSPSLFLTNKRNRFFEGADTGPADAIQVDTMVPALAAYQTGNAYLVAVANDTTSTTPTFQVGALGTRTITRADGSPCQPGDLRGGEFALLFDTGSGLQISGTITDLIASSQVRMFLNSTTFTVPAGVHKIKRARVWGAGGGGGGSSGANSSSCGGGGGGYTETANIAVTPGQVITVTIGAGGLGGVGANYGADGGTSIFGSDIPVQATGGTGGSNDNVQAQGVGGAGSGTGITAGGGYGSFPIIFGSNTAGGIGGQAPFGGTSPPIQITTTNGLDGRQGRFPGGGGNGACTGSAAISRTGGQAADGLIIIEW